MSSATIAWEPEAPENSHTEVSIHGQAVLVANDGTLKHVHGNDVREEDLMLDKSVHGTLLQMQGAAQQALSESVAQDNGTQLISDSQFGAMHDIVEGPRKSIGALMRGVKAAEPEVAATAEAVQLKADGATADAPAAEKVKSPETEKVATEEKTAMQPAEKAAKPARKPSEPVKVIELPTLAFQAVRAMHNDTSLDFTFQAANPGIVLGTGAQHGINFKQPLGPKVAAAI
ncbi:MAG: hypothetical protein EBV03_02025 [Proteobacteria bacterium]|nr:hypothetical protein [Pseudomonadota bacterium]